MKMADQQRERDDQPESERRQACLATTLCCIAFLLIGPGLVLTLIGLTILYSRCNKKSTATIVRVSATRDYNVCLVEYVYSVSNQTYTAAKRSACSPMWPADNSTQICYGAWRPHESSLRANTEFMPYETGMGLTIAGGTFLAFCLFAAVFYAICKYHVVAAHETAVRPVGNHQSIARVSVGSINMAMGAESKV